MLYLSIVMGAVLYHLVGSVAAAVHNKYADYYSKDISWTVGVFWPIMIPICLLMWAGEKGFNNKLLKKAMESLCLPYKIVRKQLDYKSQVRKQLPKATAKENK